MKETRIRFEGGPLGGTERRKTVPARSPIYRGEHGDPVSTAAGDRIVHGRSSQTAVYVRTADTTTGTIRTITYRFTNCEETQR